VIRKKRVSYKEEEIRQNREASQDKPAPILRLEVEHLPSKGQSSPDREARK
jgi:hypothetical protein